MSLFVPLWTSGFFLLRLPYQGHYHSFSVLLLQLEMFPKKTGYTDAYRPSQDLNRRRITASSATPLPPSISLSVSFCLPPSISHTHVSIISPTIFAFFWQWSRCSLNHSGPPWCYGEHCGMFCSLQQLLQLMAAAQLDSVFSFSFSSDHTPPMWYLLPYSHCDGQRQSPVNIETKKAVVDKDLGAFKFKDFKNREAIESITNTGHTGANALVKISSLS